MTAIQLVVLFVGVVFAAQSLPGTAQGNTYDVECNHETTACECPLEDQDGMPVEVCIFYLDIQHLQTFTRYKLDQSMVSGTGGRVWYIESSTGEFLAHPSGDSGSRVCDVPLNDSSCTQPYAADGYTFRSYIGVNGQLPGPTLIVNFRQIVYVNVTNRLASESVSIHWHGMHQRKANWMDGVEHVTQCGISPGTTFTYIFRADPAGTFWYHSHSGAQRTDGLVGSLIIRELPEYIADAERQLGTTFVDTPKEHTLLLLDWQEKNSIDLFTQIHSGIRFFDNTRVPQPNQNAVARTFSSDGGEVGPVSYWSGLINGRGRHSDVPYIESRLSIFSVSTDNTYRFRLVGAQNLYAYRFSIDEHQLVAIATDGVFIQPVTVDYIIIHSGERYDFLLKTKSAAELSGRMDFIIRAETLESTTIEQECGSPKPPRTDHIAEGILHYGAGEPSSNEYSEINRTSMRKSCLSNDRCKALNCPFKAYPPDYYTDCLHIHMLSLLFAESNLPNVTPDERLFFNFGLEGAAFTSAINGRNFRLPSAPPALLSDSELRALNDSEFCKELNDSSACDHTNISSDCICAQVHSVHFDNSVQMVISAVGPNPPDRATFMNAHPIHLHGHYFHVVDIQFGKYDNSSCLTEGNDDLDCGGATLCTNPRWKPGRDYSLGKNGTINATAPLKDTLLIPAGGYAVVYFQSDNPGYWFLHCHIEVHQLEGMAVIIQEASEQRTLPPNGMVTCGNFTWTVEDFKRITSGDSVLKSMYALVVLLSAIVGGTIIGQ